MGTINNFNSTITNQIIGTQINNLDNEIWKKEIQKKLSGLENILTEDKSIIKKDAIAGIQAVYKIKAIVESPQLDKIELGKALTVLASISTIGSFVKEIASLFVI